MKRRSFEVRFMVFAAALAAVAMGLPAYSNTSALSAKQSPTIVRAARSRAGLFTLYKEAGKVGCREATLEEAAAFGERDANQRLRPISPILPFNLEEGEAGLTIMLRGTPQLDSFPQAREAFLRAAEIWESRIQTPITIIVDVDFGPERFGRPYPPGVLGSTRTQSLGADDIYPDVRQALLDGASSVEETALYNSMPGSPMVATDIGNANFVLAPSATFRALGMIEPVADPVAEQEKFGDPPSIGFNSAFDYDFDPSNGIDPDKTDFEAVAVHEIGHALGFSSAVGLQELDDSEPPAIAVWDLFRLRSGTPQSAFSTAARILSSGGRQSFFAAGLDAPLSTGRPDGNGGDGNQSSHWKADEQTGRHVGIMDPTIADGDREVLTSHDLLAVETFGYTLRSGINIAPEAGDLQAVANVPGNVLTLSGAVVDLDSDASQVEIRLLNESGGELRVEPVAITNPVGSRVTSYSKEFNLGQLPGLRRAMITVRDTPGNVSQVVTTDVIFDGAQGRPTLSKVTYNGKKLKIKGQGLTGTLLVEVNGVVVAEAFGAGGKVVVKARPSALNIVSGANLVRVIGGNRRSDAATLNF